jgi:hypothetical protein
MRLWATLVLAGLSGCDCGSTTVVRGHPPDAGAGAGAAGGSVGGGGTGGGGGDDGGAGGGGSGACAGGCPGGVCIAGACCPAAAACGKTCCGLGSVCLFDACVTPGASCRTATDCGGGEYCETALGTPPDGGAPHGGDAGTCTQPVPMAGRCLALPPVCEDDAGSSDGGCIARCEYHPAVGPLNATLRWAWGPGATSFASDVDVWSTPVVGRVHDSNCDGVINELDAPVVVFVSGDDLLGNPNGGACQGEKIDGGPTMCHGGVLRMVDGASGAEIWSLDKASPSSIGFAGISLALGDVDNDGLIDIVAVTGEGYVVLLDGDGHVKRTSDVPLPGSALSTFGWGGGLALADMDGDGRPEIAFGASVFSTKGQTLKLLFHADAGSAGAASESLSTFVDLDLAPDHQLELLAGNTAYLADGGRLWRTAGVPDGFPGVGDFDHDGRPDVVLVGGGKLWLLEGSTGAIELGPLDLPGTGSGGPPTVADFDGDGKPEIGVAMANFYSVLKPVFPDAGVAMPDGGFLVVWSTPNHDLSSSVTGSTVFDFEGDGKAEVIYADECFLWVFDGQTGEVRFSAPHTSFTGTEAPLVVDVDGDGHAEIVMVTNGADPSAHGWKCMDDAGMPVTVNNVEWTPSSLPNKSYRGVYAFADAARGWVGTRTLWNEHTYHVSNICDDHDTACPAPNLYGAIPRHEAENWSKPWLNNFRQNVQDHGLFDAADGTVSLTVDCVSPVLAHVAVRNVGLAPLPAGVVVDVFRDGATPQEVGLTATTRQLLPGQTEELAVTLDAAAMPTDTFSARIVVDPLHPAFHECRADNDESAHVTPTCIQ